jgi:hypothetical protein
MAAVFLVYPTFAVYPQVMPTVQLFETLHRGEGMLSQSKRKKFFWYVFIGIFVWEWCVPSLFIKCSYVDVVVVLGSRYDVFSFIHLSSLMFGLP